MKKTARHTPRGFRLLVNLETSYASLSRLTALAVELEQDFPKDHFAVKSLRDGTICLESCISANPEYAEELKAMGFEIKN